MTIDNIFESLQHLPVIYRGAPFWSWNGFLEENELRLQIRQMKAAGLGGFFMHSRIGLKTPYLQKEWFEKINVCIDEAQKNGMYAYIYDEDRWPSGSAGGLATKEEKYRQQFLRAAEFDSVSDCKKNPGVLAYFTAVKKGRKLYDLHYHKTIPAELEQGSILIRISHETAIPSTWYNNSTYLNTLDPEAVQNFINITYEAYWREAGAHFGKTVPAIFADEPLFGVVNLPEHNGSHTAPWTTGLDTIFEKKFGYSLVEHLAEIFYEVDGIGPSCFVMNYMECLTDLFLNAYVKPLNQWCKDHGIVFTGHVRGEDFPDAQAAHVGNCMRIYEYMQTPGIDQLSEYWEIYDTVKQLSSVAHQLDRKWRMSECYGCTGWDFNFAGHKALGDWQTVLGINQRCQHLAWYTMKGEAKRDYPAAISYQSPWFSHYHVIEDYFARLNVIFSEGEELRDYLVIHPLESTWMLMGYREGGDLTKIHRIDDGMLETRDWLLRNHCDFDYGDEDIIARYGKIENSSFIIGKASYKYIIIPAMLTMRSSTLDLLLEFHKLGGKILLSPFGQIPEYFDGLPDAEKQQLLISLLDKKSETLSKLISITDTCGVEAGSVLYQLRQRDDGLSLMLCNTGFTRSVIDRRDCEQTIGNDHRLINRIKISDRNQEYSELEITVKTDFSGEWIELDLDTGCKYSVDSSYVNGYYCYKTALSALQSRVFLLVPKNTCKDIKLRKNYSVIDQQTFDTTPWNFLPDELNVAVADIMTYSINGEKKQSPCLITYIDDEIRKRLNVNIRGHEMVQPWANTVHKNNVPCANLNLYWNFIVNQIPKKQIYWAMEQPERAKVKINGNLLNSDSIEGFWVDKSLQKLPIPIHFLQEGENLVEISMKYNPDIDELEAMYLLGEFCVSFQKEVPILNEKKELLLTGDWCLQGFPCYSGNGIYHREFQWNSKETVPVLQIKKFGGAAIRVILNDKIAGYIYSPPYQLDISSLIKQGKNNLKLEVLGTRRNSHGPFFCEKAHPMWTDSCCLKSYVCKERRLVPMGLLEEPVLLECKEQ